MKKNNSTRAGSEVQYGPRTAGEILQGFNPTTEICIDLKTILRSDRRARIKKDYTGVLTRDGSEHFTFLETRPWNMKRNPKVFNGKYISVTRQDDGSLRPNFKAMKMGAGFKVERYALGAYNELCMALEGLIEERIEN